MNAILRKTLIVCLFLCPLFALADDKLKIKFGKIDPQDFSLPDEEYLKTAEAVYLADIGSTVFEGNNKGSFTMIFKRHVRIKINNNNGFDEADFEIPMYFESGGTERVVQLKGITYNLENGKVVETALKDDQIFVDKQNKNFWLKKFTMPAVKTGSIIDVVYTIESEFIRYLRGWKFQDDCPRMWSEYTVQIPELLDYVTLSQGYRKFDVVDNSEFQKTYMLSTSSLEVYGERIPYDSKVFERRWVMKNVPALKLEPYTSSIYNHVSKIDFQLSRLKFKDSPWKDLMGNYVKVAETMNENEYFGASLYKNNNWMDDEIKQITAGTTDTLEKAKKIYNNIRDNYSCIDSRGIYLTDKGIKDIVKTKKGSVADLNLLLVAMLQHEGITAYPVILSTRDHGITHEVYPLMSRFNLTVAVALIGDKEYFLDASDPLLGFGKLDDYCYNGHARVINASSVPVYLDADNLVEKKLTSIFISNNEKGGWEGVKSTRLGYVESHALRERIRKSSKEAVLKTYTGAASSEVNILSAELENVDDKEDVVSVKCNLAAKTDDDIIYLNPLFGEALSENPFKSAERYYPIEMPYAEESVFVATIDVPKGYKVDEVPKSVKVKLNEDDGMFTYLVSVQESQVLMRMTLSIKKANFPADDYQTLRDFYGYIVNKQSEQIVFKKLESN